MKVVCICVGNKYPPVYVERLRQGLARHTDRDFDFACISEGQYPGWWNKVLLFPPEERTVYLDLDVVITGNVDFLFDYAGLFCIWKDPWADGFNSSVMSIAPGFGAAIRARFLADPATIMGQFYSDQEFITAVVGHADTWQQIAPGKVKSFKADRLKTPDGVSIAVFHGEPKPHQLPDVPWVQEHWSN